MSDDLISRKALLDRFRYGDKESESDKAWICAVRRMIKEQSTAFDKEKVIEELVELRQKEYSDSDEEIEIIDGEEIYDEGRSQGRFEAYHRAIKIVEKGGIE